MPDKSQRSTDSTDKPRILIVEDELPMRTALADCLGASGYRVMVASDGRQGLERAIQERPDLVLLDIMMPHLDGFSVCRELRRLSPGVGILILTAKGQLEDRIKGLDVGADDYLVKPFSTEELLARVRAISRRVRQAAKPMTLLTLGDVRIDFARQQAWRKKVLLRLTAKEFATLRLLAEAAGEPVTRDEFLDRVWGYGAFPTTRTVDNHIASLRAKIDPNPENPRWIQTVHGVGYRLMALE